MVVKSCISKSEINSKSRVYYEEIKVVEQMDMSAGEIVEDGDRRIAENSRG